MRLAVLFLAITVACVAGSSRAASITPTSQSRTITASAFDFNSPVPGSTSQSASAPDFGAFDRTLSVSYFQGQGSASQSSEILSTNVTASGSGSGFSTSFDNGGSGASTFELVFQLSEPSDYALTGNLAVGWFGNFAGANASVDLVGVFTDSLAATNAFFGSASHPISLTGTLSPGIYTLRALASGSSPPSSGNGSASYQISFMLIPEAGTSVMILSGLALLAAWRSVRLGLALSGSEHVHH